MNILSASRLETQYSIETVPCSSRWRAGHWLNGRFRWLNSNTPDKSICSEEFEVKQLSSYNTKVVFWRLTIPNQTSSYSLHKIFFEYEGDCSSNTAAFYSPNEQAIMHSANGTVSLLGGIMEGKGLTQYCIRQKGRDSLFKSKLDGTLNFSPLARGNVISTYSLEALLAPGEDAAATAWMIVSNCKDEAVTLNDQLKNRADGHFYFTS
ncbi:hypothetical protein D0469_18965 [Peribacillus saganii]|uniref:Uncharacterized protein n=1 Tax=Peribacillus saganii TaxID=2303992 RepID=A0A372LDW9_9BACI|nr:hypothetical protein [Peribacillus saganii]RFU64285.1 hypothetical protein D0469_18965 [Peribacillus saganii]